MGHITRLPVVVLSLISTADNKVRRRSAPATDLSRFVLRGGIGNEIHTHQAHSWSWYYSRIVVFAFAALSIARTLTTSVNIVNNSSRAISHVYLSHVGRGRLDRQPIGESVIASGQSYNLTNVACDQQQVKIIGEDQDGCFVSTVVNWAITPLGQSAMTGARLWRKLIFDRRRVL